MFKLVLFSCVVMTFGQGLLARELPDSLLPVNVVGVQLHPESQVPVVLLSDPDSQGVVPIFIGTQEAQAIVMAMDSVTTPRPMTHDITVSIMLSLNGELERLIIDQLTQNTYLGLLEVTTPAREKIYLDVRPSDGLALAVRTGAAVWVLEELLIYPNEAGEWQLPSRPSL